MRNFARFWRGFACFLVGLLAVVGLASIPVNASSGTAEVPHFNLGHHHHPISTQNKEAQRYFDQGLNLTYGFNHAEAVRAFQEAARLDRDCAICYWGVAYALGPNINAAMSPEAVPQAWQALQRAIALSPKASQSERSYIDALAKRYAPDVTAARSPLDLAFADAMRAVVKRYPKDLDAATLLAEALMDTTPWSYWTPAGKPKPVTEELVSVLESVLQQAPNHPGAIHLYIHAVEASPHPERAEAAADRLRQLVPDSGHLLHMPAHIYLRIGRYHDSSLANERAIAADESYARVGSPGLYLNIYYPHNIHFLAYSAAMEGRKTTALAAARKLAAGIPLEQARAIPMLQWLKATPLFTLSRFGQWDAILQEPQPSSDLIYDTAIWHYARGLAFAAKDNLPQALAESEAVHQLAQSEAIAALEVPLLYASSQLSLADKVLGAEVARVQGDRAHRIRQLQSAVDSQAALPYMEPPYWYLPVGEYLGDAWLDSNMPAEAERAYRRDLEQHPNSGWSLFGLLESLRSQGKATEAEAIQTRFQDAWKHADVTLTASRF